MPSHPDSAARTNENREPGTLRTPEDAAAWLCSAPAVRVRANEMLALAERDALAHFKLNPERLAPAADYVLQTIREHYPSLEIPFHSRWRHFNAGGIDRWARLAADIDSSTPPDERARIRFDLAVTSVLLDAGAGDRWRYHDPDTGERYGRSEGLAVASFNAFRDGLFSAEPGRPLRAEGDALAGVTTEDLARVMQVDSTNPLVGLDERAALVRRLGAALASRSDLFGTDPARIGNLFDHLASRAVEGALPAAAILDALLAGLGDIWPGRPVLGGVNLGDVWRHPAIDAGDASDGWVPFHKLSQWLAYSLVEPLVESGIRVTNLDALTGLPEYRNGGLLIDTGVLEIRDPAAATVPQEVGSPLVVEWRALTVALLDRLAERVRKRLDLDLDRLPLIKVLEGGTWLAGRRIAREHRGDSAPPPLQVISDGTVF